MRGKLQVFRRTHFERGEVSGDFRFTRNVDQNESAETLNDGDLSFIRSGGEENRSVMASRFGIVRSLDGETDFPGFADREGKVLVFDGNPIRKGEFVGSLVLRLYERRGSRIVAGNEIFLRSIEGYRLVGIVRDFHDT